MTDTTTALRLANELRDPQATMTSRLCAADAIDALAQERDALVERSRWNIREEGDDLLICRGDHHRAEKCEWERYVPDAERDAARAEVERLKHEVAALRLTLGGKTFDATVPEPIGCPLPGACATVVEIVRGREATAAWLRVIQAENTCAVTGKPCDAVRCGCAAEQEMLIREAKEGGQ